MSIDWALFSEIFRNFALAVAGTFGAILAWLRLRPEKVKTELAQNEFGMSRRAHVSDIFNRAASQLGDDRLIIRMAGVFTLKEVAIAFPDLSEPVYELLQAYVRDYNEKHDESDDGDPADIDACMEILLGRLTK